MSYSTFLKQCCLGNNRTRPILKGALLTLAMVLIGFAHSFAQNATGEEQRTQSISNSPVAQSGAWDEEGSPNPNAYDLNAIRSNYGWARNSDLETFPNPDLAPNTFCNDLNVVIVLDASGSMSGTGEAEARVATLAVAKAFQNSSAQLRIVQFAAQAQEIDLGGTFVDQTFIDNLTLYLAPTGPGYNGQRYFAIPGSLNSEGCRPGYTNWEDALQSLQDPNNIYNLAFFVTDGNPTAYNDLDNACGYIVSIDSDDPQETIDISLVNAIQQANILKEDFGTHIFAVGVGSNVTVSNLKAISGGDESIDFGDFPNIYIADFVTAELDNFENLLAAAINSICGTRLALTKTADRDQVCNDDQVIKFTLEVENIGRVPLTEDEPLTDDLQVAAANVVIVDAFPAGFTNFSLVAPIPAGAAFDEESNTLIFNIESLPFGEGNKVSIEVEATVNADNDVPVTNIAEANANNADIVSASATVVKTEIVTFTTDTSACESYTWDLNNVTYTESGMYFTEAEFDEELGCSVQNKLNLVINPAKDLITDVVVSCGPFTWERNGVEYAANGDYFFSDTDFPEGECPQEYKLVLTIGAGSVVENVQVVCDGFFFEDNFGTYFSSGIYNRLTSQLNPDGCPITNRLYLTLGGSEGQNCYSPGDAVPNPTGTVTEDCGCEPGEVQPEPCTISGEITELSTTCDPQTGLYSIHVLLTYANAPNEGDLMVNGNSFPITGSPQSVALTQASGPVVISASFSDSPNCALTLNTQTVLEQCEQDCNDVYGGTSEHDECGVCLEGGASNPQWNQSCLDCANVPNGGAETDECGVCVPDGETSNDWNTTCADCNGLPNGPAVPDSPCDPGEGFENGILNELCQCIGDPITPEPIFGCTDPEALNFDPTATVDDGSCTYSGTGECTEYRYYLADSPVGVSSSNIYGVEISGGNANLTLLTTVGYQAHIGYNEATNELYIVNRNNGAFHTYDLGTSTLSGPTSLSMNLLNVAQAVVSPAGDLIVGSETTNDVYTVNVLTGNVTPFPGDALTSINGGDLVYGADGTLYYASRNGGGSLINVLTNTVVGNLPTNVTGAALMDNGNLLTSSRSFDDLRAYGPTGSATELAIYPTLLDGEPIVVKPTDLASGCTDGEFTEEACYGQEALYYKKGTGNVAMDRQNPLKATGMPEDDDSMNFVSLGFGGELIIGFEDAATAAPGVDDLKVVETTFGTQTCTSYEERADIYVSQAQLLPGDNVLAVSDWVLVGQSCTNGASFDVYAETEAATGTAWTYFTLVKFIDQSPVVGNRDGYDVDGIIALQGCEPAPEFVPEPGDCYGAEVLVYNPEGDLPASRTMEIKMTGKPERDNTLNFATLGFGGYAILGFDGAAMTDEGDDLEIAETSFGDPACASYTELADIYVSQQVVNDASEIVDAQFVLVGQSCTNGVLIDLADTPATEEWTFFTLVKIVDVTPEEDQFGNRDGFDLDGIVALHNDCREVPSIANDAVQSTSAAVRNSLDTYPNPTSGPVTIEFTTNVEQRVSLEIIDLSGRMIETLFNQNANADQVYRLDFNTAQLPNGIYLTKMTTDTDVIVKKVMVAR